MGVKASVDLHIEKLVLEGLPPGEHDRLAEVVKNELLRLIADHGVSPALTQSYRIERLDGGALELEQRSDAQAIGLPLAKAIHGALQ